MNNNFQTRQQSLRHFRHSLGNQLRQIIISKVSVWSAQEYSIRK